MSQKQHSCQPIRFLYHPISSNNSRRTAKEEGYRNSPVKTFLPHDVISIHGAGFQNGEGRGWKGAASDISRNRKDLCRQGIASRNAGASSFHGIFLIRVWTGKFGG
ncbi:hypothetical protein CDAR_244761 [Caerostris darwini]|uniref:Uncharacterized protein n=1 Tax=Caerostris darwini TaxID=1538125 RepID=A0AAV4MLZ6_9ARAC|nr:hypothetical protein CDAR_244761 [Caerostris darwini]